MKQFRDLVISATEMLIEDTERESSAVDSRMKKHGYGSPQPGAEGHITFTNVKNELDQILIDVPGGEWHHMTKGVINKIGGLKDESLEQYLEANPDGIHN